MFDAGPNKHDNIAWIIALAEISTDMSVKTVNAATKVWVISFKSGKSQRNVHIQLKWL